MRKPVVLFLVSILCFSIVSSGQVASKCNSLSVRIDSIVVQPCFLDEVAGGGVDTTGIGGGGGFCGCSNTLWAVVNGGTGPYSYLWTPGGSTMDTLQKACYEVFTVLVTDNNNCTAVDSLNVLIPPTITTGINTTGLYPQKNAGNIILYPVPATDQLNFSLDESMFNAAVEVYDLLGRKLTGQKITTSTGIFRLDISALQPGNYFLKTSAAGWQKTNKFSVVR